MNKNIEQLVLECLENDFDRDFLYSIKRLDIESVVSRAVEFDEPSINDLINIALNDYALYVLRKEKYKVLYKGEYGYEDEYEFLDKYVDIYVNGLDTHLNLNERAFSHFEDINLLEKLDKELRNFK